jgi:hypothetical protein
VINVVKEIGNPAVNVNGGPPVPISILYVYCYSYITPSSPAKLNINRISANLGIDGVDFCIAKCHRNIPRHMLHAVGHFILQFCPAVRSNYMITAEYIYTGETQDNKRKQNYGD